jgi:hypothetical protein
VLVNRAMKAFLAKIAKQKAIGLYIDDHEIALSLVAATGLGPVEMARAIEPYQPGQLPSVLEKMLSPWRDRRKRFRLPVALGLPALRVFFSTRPHRLANRDASPEVLLRDMIQSPNFSIDDLVVDLVKAQPGRDPLVSIVSARKKYLAGLLADLEECGVRPPRAEPSPCALLRAGEQQRKSPRRTKVVVRLYLGAGQALAVVAAGRLPIVWRYCDLAEQGQVQAIRSVIRGLQGLIKFCGMDRAMDLVVVHGRGSLRGEVENPQFQEALGVKVVWCEGPGLENGQIAFGLALGGLNYPQWEGFDLARSLKPPPSLRALFPWQELAVQLACLACMALFLISRSQSLAEDFQAVRAENAKRAWAETIALPALEKERKELAGKVEAIGRFVDSRILWSRYMNDIASRLPAQASLDSFQALNELDSGSSTAGIKPKKSLILRASVPVPPTGSMPQEIDGFLKALRDDQLLRRDFNLLELTDLKMMQTARKTKYASFSVLCLPQSSQPPSKTSAPQDKEHAKTAGD